MLYTKRIQRNGYVEVKTVDENGNFHLYHETKNVKGETVKFSEHRDTIFKMGWHSVEEFLKERMKGYKTE